MGKIKEARTKDTKEYPLKTFELEYLKQLALSRNAAYNQWQQAIQVFLSYVAGTRLGYKENQILEFQFDSENGNLKVTVKEERDLPKE